MDYFNINFIAGMHYVTALIVAGCSLNDPSTSPRIVAMGTPILLITTCSQLLYSCVSRFFKKPYPARFSSMPKGAETRPGLYTIVEDIVAVDGGQGQEFRKIWNDRYIASYEIRVLLGRLDYIWGVSGILLAGALIGVIWGVDDVDIGYALGESSLNNSSLLFIDDKLANIHEQVGSLLGSGQDVWL